MLPFSCWATRMVSGLGEVTVSLRPAKCCMACARNSVAFAVHEALTVRMVVFQKAICTGTRGTRWAGQRQGGTAGAAGDAGRQSPGEQCAEVRAVENGTHHVPRLAAVGGPEHAAHHLLAHTSRVARGGGGQALQGEGAQVN